MEDYRRYMKRALNLALKGEGRTSPNPLVGSVVVKDGRIVGEGFHEKAGMPHAEAVALDNAGEDARGADLIVTLEPCCHHGKTPPCTERIRESGVKRVVAAMMDPNPLVSGKGIDELQQAGIEVITGVWEQEARDMNEFFIHHVTTGTPFVILKSAASLDGKIATSTGESKWITNEKSRNYVHAIRNRVDAILAGIGTVLKDDPGLTARLPGGGGKNPLRIILDSNLRIPLNSKVLSNGSSAGTIVVAVKGVDHEKISTIEECGAEVMTVSDENGRIDLKALMTLLGERGITSVLIEGGSQVNASAIESGVVNKVFYFVSPSIIGGNKAPTAFGGKGVERLSDSIRLENINVRRFDDDILIEGYVRGRN